MALTARDRPLASRSQSPRQLLKALPKPTLLGCYKMYEKFWTLPNFLGRSTGFYLFQYLDDLVFEKMRFLHNLSWGWFSRNLQFSSAIFYGGLPEEENDGQHVARSATHRTQSCQVSNLCIYKLYALNFYIVTTINLNNFIAILDYRQIMRNKKCYFTFNYLKNTRYNLFFRIFI